MSEPLLNGYSEEGGDDGKSETEEPERVDPDDI